MGAKAKLENTLDTIVLMETLISHMKKDLKELKNELENK